MARVVLQNSNRADNMEFMTRKNSWWFFAISTSAMMIVYFILSIGLTFYQRKLLKTYRFPLFIVVCHLVIKLISASIFRHIWQCVHQRKRISLDCRNQVLKIAPIGIASGLDVGFSNWGMGQPHFTVALYVMTKSTTIIFILGFALLFKLEKKSWSVVVIVAMISGGLSMFTYKATYFDIIGFLLVLFASFSSGLRWTLIQFIMQKSEHGLRHPLDMLYHVQPWMLIAIFPLAVLFEGSLLNSALSGEPSWRAVMHPLALIVAGGFIALAMELSEYFVVSQTSSLTLSVAGIVKEVITLVLAVEWEGDQLTLVNVAGLVMCVGGIACHVAVKAASTTAHIPPTPLHKPLLDPAATAAAFLPGDSSEDDDDNQQDNSSTEVLFSILNSRSR